MKYIVARGHEHGFVVMERRIVSEVEVYEPVVAMPAATAAEADRICRALELLDRQESNG